MRRKFLLTVLLLVLSAVQMHVAAQPQPDKSIYQSRHKVKKWFNRKEWLNGAAFNPHKAINKTEFARQYYLNKSYWDKAFNFLKEHNLKNLPVGKYPIDGTNVFATLTEDPSKDLEKTQWESHRKYIDLQCVIDGEEKMGKFPFGQLTVTKPYDEAKDVANYSGEGKKYIVPAGTFMIFFPSDAHRPNITLGGNKVIKKIVIKILAAQ
jgi:YhcH/YjgK/YiaL family protein